jgi:hypothetical protein
MEERPPFPSGCPTVMTTHRLNMELDLWSSFGFHLHCAQLYLLAETPQEILPPHIRGRYLSAGVDDISLWHPAADVRNIPGWYMHVSISQSQQYLIETLRSWKQKDQHYLNLIGTPSTCSERYTLVKVPFLNSGLRRLLGEKIGNQPTFSVTRSDMASGC